MKKIATIIAVMISITAYSQIVVYASQDLRMATIGDDKGNEAFTTNINAGLEMRQNMGNFDILVRPDLEFADLKGGKFARFSGNVGINFRECLKDFEFTSTIGYGITRRFGLAFTGFGANFQTTYKLNKKFGIFADAEFLQRNDLKTPVIRFSGKIGIKYYF